MIDHIKLPPDDWLKIYSESSFTGRAKVIKELIGDKLFDPDNMRDALPRQNDENRYVVMDILMGSKPIKCLDSHDLIVAFRILGLKDASHTEVKTWHKRIMSTKGNK